MSDETVWVQRLLTSRIEFATAPGEGLVHLRSPGSERARCGARCRSARGWANRPNLYALPRAAVCTRCWNQASDWGWILVPTPVQP